MPAPNTMLPGKGARYKVATAAAGPFEPVKRMNAYNQEVQNNVTSYPTMDDGVPPSLADDAAPSYTLSGYLVPADPGQQIIRAAARNKTTVFLQILPDGVDGFVFEARISSGGAGFPITGYQTTTFTATPADTPAGTPSAIGATGYIL